MSETLDPLVLDLVEWVAHEPRAYRDVLETWRTSCPRLTVWEDAVDRGYLTRQHTAEQGTMVIVTPEGQRFLQSNGRPANA